MDTLHWTEFLFHITSLVLLESLSQNTLFQLHLLYFSSIYFFFYFIYFFTDFNWGLIHGVWNNVLYHNMDHPHFITFGGGFVVVVGGGGGGGGSSSVKVWRYLSESKNKCEKMWVVLVIYVTLSLLLLAS